MASDVVSQCGECLRHVSLLPSTAHKLGRSHLLFPASSLMTHRHILPSIASSHISGHHITEYQTAIQRHGYHPLSTLGDSPGKCQLQMLPGKHGKGPRSAHDTARLPSESRFRRSRRSYHRLSHRCARSHATPAPFARQPENRQNNISCLSGELDRRWGSR